MRQKILERPLRAYEAPDATLRQVGLEISFLASDINSVSVESYFVEDDDESWF